MPLCSIFTDNDPEASIVEHRRVRRDRPRIAIVGAGLGGATAAVLLAQAGYTVSIYEQAPAFGRVGAGIHLTANVMKVMRHIGVERRLRETGFEPANWFSRDAATGDVLLEIPLGRVAEERYGAPYLTVHRGDFHDVLTNAIPPGAIQLNKRLVGLDTAEKKIVRLEFHDGTVAEADLVIGADGLNSKVREMLLGPEKPLYSGYVAHRSAFPASLLGELQLQDCVKWWSSDRHIVVYYITRSRSEIYLVTGVPEPEWTAEAAWVPSTTNELRRAFEGYHPDIQQLIGASREVTKWPLMERDPLPLWSRGRAVLVGDACHPMKPHMAQGAAMAIEDAAMLVRCLTEVGADSFDAAFKLYEANRVGRTSRVQRGSQRNIWLRDPSDGNPDWVFDYDVFDVALVPAAERDSRFG
jgi:6-hydroxynicotinate 3-monooxygenase